MGLRQNSNMLIKKSEIIEAAAALQRGDLVALPTETVYGLGADAANPDAIKKIFVAKGRPEDHPLIVHIAKGAPLGHWAVQVPAAAHQLIAAFWPGPLTLILKRSKRIPLEVTGGQETVGIRCPAHPMAQALLAAFAKIGSGIIAAPSANKFGHVSPTTAQHVRDEFGDAVGHTARDMIYLLDGGACDVGIESTILDLSRDFPVLLRPGAISSEQIRDVIGKMPLTREEAETAAEPEAEAAVEKEIENWPGAKVSAKKLPGARHAIESAVPRVSGSLAAHYAPHTPLALLTAVQLQAKIDALLDAGKRVAVLAFTAQPKVKPSPVGVGIRNARRLVWITGEADPAGYAQGLYANLRTLDAAETEMILVEAPPASTPWDAINDRLSRAAFGSGRHQ